MDSRINTTIVKSIASISLVDKQQWNSLNSDENPFVRYEFLYALEKSGCVGTNTGWTPCHLIAYSTSEENSIIAALPVYLKTHSYGEYVFDWAWANFYQHEGLPYYPKLVVAIPFSPVPGPRLLTDAKDSQYQHLLSQFSGQLDLLVEKYKASSIHWLFHPQSDKQLLQQSGYGSRIGYQYHWDNQGMHNFEDYLARFKSKPRKNIRRERQRIKDIGISFQWKNGADISEQDIDNFYQFYLSTVDSHQAYAYLNVEFFRLIRMLQANSIRILFASLNNQLIAGALFMSNDTTLYGRYWGSSSTISGLHFETCYYQALDYCIQNRISRFEAGAQGEHKMSRGLLPTLTYSSHLIENQTLAPAIYDFLEHESAAVNDTISMLKQHSPFKSKQD